MKIEDRDVIYEKVVGPMYEDGTFPLTLADEISMAIEKQIPKYVLVQHNEDYFTGKCPCCKSTLADINGAAFCRCCGQALRWLD